MTNVEELHARFVDALGRKRVCVTGGAGFIGGHLSRALLEIGAEVCIIDDLSASSGQRLDDLFAHAKGRLDFVHGSILDRAALLNATENCEFIFHLAAVASVGESIRNPRRTIDVNAAGTARVAEAARLVRARRIIFASSSSVYGDQETPHRETLPPRPLSPYAASKASGEHIIKAWSSSMGIDGISLRLFNVFGTHQQAESLYSAVIPTWIQRLQRGLAPIIYGTGEQTRDFISVQEVVRAMLMGASNEGKLHGEAVNIGSGVATSINALASMLIAGSGLSSIEPEYQQARDGEIAHSHADLTKAYAVLGYVPQHDLEDALAELMAHAGESGAHLSG